MLKTSLAFILAIRAVAHWGSVVHPDKPLFYPVIEVRDCSGGHPTLYSDEKLTTQIPNPFIGDQNGFYSYYTTTPYVKESILLGSETIAHSTCLIRSPENGQH